MQWNDLSQWFFSQYQGVPTYLIIWEFIAVIFGLLSVLLARKGNIWVYPTGIISTVIFVYLLWISELWGDMLINFYYTAMSLYGWVLWYRSSADHLHVNISKTTKHDLQRCAILSVCSAFLVGIVYYLKPYIQSQLAWENFSLTRPDFSLTQYIDIATTAIFLVGMWLMAKRKIENWIFWIVGDLISVPLYYYKGLKISALQYAIFTIIAILGYIEWKRKLQQQRLQT